MFSGKTARMMLDVKKITACGLRSMTIKNSIDERTMQAVWSRFNDIKEEAHSCKNLKEITIMDEVDVIAIDEGQFVSTYIYHY
jgi:thymidine kinase